jgi:hypothetical protein
VRALVELGEKAWVTGEIVAGKAGEDPEVEIVS